MTVLGIGGTATRRSVVRESDPSGYLICCPILERLSVCYDAEISICVCAIRIWLAVSDRSPETQISLTKDVFFYDPGGGKFDAKGCGHRGVHSSHQAYSGGGGLKSSFTYGVVGGSRGR